MSRGTEAVRGGVITGMDSTERAGRARRTEEARRGAGAREDEGSGRAVAVHLAAVWVLGCVLTGAETILLLASLFGDDLGVVVAVALLALCAGVALTAWLGSAARSHVPFTRGVRGLWTWAVLVHVAGAAAAFGAVLLDRAAARSGGSGPSHLLVGGTACALVAAFFVPRTRVRTSALALTAVLAAGVGWSAWTASRPPTLDAWLTSHRVDRALARIGEAPPGHTAHVRGASEDAFGVEYTSDGGGPGFSLRVEREGHDTRRADARGCPVPLGDPVRCVDDGEGRLLITYGGGGAPVRELRLRRAGLVHVVSLREPAALGPARRVLATLRPATDAELEPLLSSP
ncbi:hypothetical protein ACN20G_33095 (plasmid) [Streptomyces sp. BI20]|uniref:hypothetical protein n=1 Tax=Streptomyces sp. BI20 TaxID=3403460 RepID=UPI003C760507